MKAPRSPPQRSQGITARRPDQFARKPVHNGRNPANTNTSRNQKLTAGQRVGSSSRTTKAAGRAKSMLARPCWRSHRTRRRCSGAGAMCPAMPESPVPSLSPSERQTLRHVAQGEFHATELDWVAVQRLSKMGLIEERGGIIMLTREGQQV